MSRDNMILLTDSYKASHYLQYPPDTTKVGSYFESRGGQFGEVVFAGLQYILKRYFTRPITMQDIDEADELFKLHFGSSTLFNRMGWEHILHDHGGKLPLRIKAVKEGTVVPTSNVLMTVENTCPQCYWLTNYAETILVQSWYPTTVATLSREMKKMILRYLEETGDPGLISFKLHDFGFRGVSSVESAGIGGLAHLINFMGTDTVAALTIARDYYSCPIAGFSIPAAEHSTITAWEKEADAFRNMIDQFGSGPLYAVVSDSYNIYEACEKLWGQELKDQVLNANGTLVVRPDSGDPPQVVRQILDILGKAFGYTVNSKGYKVLNPKVRVIQGDGVNYVTAELVLREMRDADWSADNVAFGMGGALLQRLDRDTQRFAFKCCFIETKDGTVREVSKSPVTDPGKKSKSGKLCLIKKDGQFHTVKANVWRTADTPDLLEVVYENGEIKRDQSLDEIRSLAAV